MKSVLFVSNGHGEVAIAARIVQELVQIASAACDHLALVGDFAHPSLMRDVGPRRAMPSGGLLAMGNVRNIARDVGAGLIPHTLAQLRFLRDARGKYAACVAVGDVFALAMALRAGAPTLFAGTAKSVHVAPYGRFEEGIIRRARIVYARDDATAQRLREHGIAARSGNAIVDLYPPERSSLNDLGFAPNLALFPGSREAAYGDARTLCAIALELARTQPSAGAVLSIAPGLDPGRMANAVQQGELHAVQRAEPNSPFVLQIGDREVIRAWRGPLGSMIACADAVLGQAGTANEAAAAAGVPVIAFAKDERSKSAWYRRRQAGLLGGALCIVSGDTHSAAVEIAALLDDPRRRAHMGAVGRERMGPAGTAAAIARDVAELIA